MIYVDALRREDHRDNRARVQAALDCQRAAMQFDKALCQGQAKTGALIFAGEASGDLLLLQMPCDEVPMTISNPIDLLFGGMEKLAPGGDVHTRHVLSLLPKGSFQVIVDAGCGSGRQTMILAKELGTLVHAVDFHEPFLNALKQRAADAKLEHLVQTHCMDMKDIPFFFRQIDLLWSEGAAYNIGFANALTLWARAINPGGGLVVSELAWLQEQVPDTAREFFQSCYPDMKHISQNITVAENAGYSVLDTYTVPREAWVEGYYDVLEPRAKALLDHPDSTVREFACETVKEIEIFRTSEDSYGYVFYVLQRA